MARARLFVPALCLGLALFATAAPQLSAQGRNRFRDRDFGLSKDEWCREDRSGNWRRSAFACDVREETLSSVKLIDADTGGNGGIRVRGANRTDVRVRAKIAAWARDQRDADDLVNDAQLTTRDGRIRVDTAARRGDDEGVTVSFEIEVPRNMEMNLDTRNGGISIQSYGGRADARTVNGGISLDDVGGDIRATTVNGGISIALDGRRWEGAGLDAETRNGGVSMSLPSDFSAELDAATTNGGIDVDFPITVQGRLTRINRHITATIGSGGPRLRVTTTNGGVRIRRR